MTATVRPFVWNDDTGTDTATEVDGRLLVDVATAGRLAGATVVALVDVVSTADLGAQVAAMLGGDIQTTFPDGRAAFDWTDIILPEMFEAAEEDGAEEEDGADDGDEYEASDRQAIDEAAGNPEGDPTLNGAFG